VRTHTLPRSPNLPRPCRDVSSSLCAAISPREPPRRTAQARCPPLPCSIRVPLFVSMVLPRMRTFWLSLLPELAARSAHSPRSSLFRPSRSSRNRLSESSKLRQSWTLLLRLKLPSAAPKTSAGSNPRPSLTPLKKKRHAFLSNSSSCSQMVCVATVP